MTETETTRTVSTLSDDCLDVVIQRSTDYSDNTDCIRRTECPRGEDHSVHRCVSTTPAVTNVSFSLR